MSYQIHYEYTTTTNGLYLLNTYISSNSAFNLGGYTLRPTLTLANEFNSSVSLETIEPANGFFASSNLSTGTISAFSTGDGGQSVTREGKSGHWLLIASHTLSQAPEHNIDVATEINNGDFFLSSGDDITITSTQNIVLTRQGNFSGTLTLSGTPAQNQTLTAASSIEDPDGIAGVITFSWQRSTSGSNGWSTIAAANTSSYTLTQDDVDFYIRAVASYTDNLGTPESVASAPTAAAISNINDNPVLTGTPVALPNGTEDITYVLNASDLLQGYTDIDGDILSITIITTTSANGTITNNGDGTWSYLPTTDLNGDLLLLCCQRW